MAYAKVQGATPTSTAGAVTSQTTGTISAATANNLLLCAVVVMGTASSPAVTGYTQLGSTWVNSANATIFLFGKIAAGGETSAAASWTGSGRCCAFLYEFSGNPTTLTGIVVSAVTATTNATTATPAITGAGSTVDGTELVVAMHGRISRSAYTAASVTGGFTEDDDGLSTDGTASTGSGMTFTHKILTANETPSTGVTIANSRACVSAVIALKAAGGSIQTITPATVSGAAAVTASLVKTAVVAPAVNAAAVVSATVVRTAVLGPAVSAVSAVTAAVVLAGAAALVFFRPDKPVPLIVHHR